MKFVSDIDMVGNKFAIEWEYETGGRFWEKFDTAEERNEALRQNQKWIDEHRNEVDEYLLQEEINFLEMISEDRFCLTPYDEARIDWYSDLKSKNHKFSLSDFTDFYNDYVAKMENK